MGKTIGIGIIGTGRIFQTHMNAYESLRERANVVGVADVSPEKLREATQKFFLPITSQNPRDIINRDDVQVVDICTPPFAHEEVIVEALEAGKHVMCEKPIAHNLASADRIIQAASRYPGKLSIIYQLRHAPHVRKMIWLRDQGYAGRLCFGRFTRMDRIPAEHMAKGSWWGRWSVAGGGVVMTQFIHELDTICHLFGKPVSVTANIDTVASGIDSEDTFSASIRFANGALVDCSSTVVSHTSSSTFDVVGEKLLMRSPWEVMSVDRGHQIVSLTELDKVFPPPPQAAPPPPPSFASRVKRKLGLAAPVKPAPAAQVARHQLHADYFVSVLDAIEAGQPLPISAEEARVSLDLCAGIYASGILGRTVDLPLDGDSLIYNGVTNEYYAQRQCPRVDTPAVSVAE